MADSTFTIKEYNREAWTLADLRQVVADLADWDGAAPMTFASFNGGTRSAAGSMTIRSSDAQ
ncbi:hypothetical protein MINTM005_13650 [Mycobacterium intracellulare]|uniref:hypothetical protein n=1 Tax=Mycobacterium intracellulare TaxID=1767 RepID=UPI0019285AFB|nr:hypothetical protein [Mycobacterium intracellulare]BCO56121.1 hypothetical protein MINTM005_13650 [Mycobacterium intracellulare]